MIRNIKVKYEGDDENKEDERLTFSHTTFDTLLFIKLSF